MCSGLRCALSLCSPGLWWRLSGRQSSGESGASVCASTLYIYRYVHILVFDVHNLKCELGATQFIAVVSCYNWRLEYLHRQGWLRTLVVHISVSSTGMCMLNPACARTSLYRFNLWQSPTVGVTLGIVTGHSVGLTGAQVEAGCAHNMFTYPFNLQESHDK